MMQAGQFEFEFQVLGPQLSVGGRLCGAAFVILWGVTAGWAVLLDLLSLSILLVAQMTRRAMQSSSPWAFLIPKCLPRSPASKMRR